MSATPVPLTEAERAALAAMMGNPSPQNCWCDWAAGDLPCDDCSLAARAVVAAVRPLLAADALAWVASSPERWNGYCCHDHMAGVVMKAAEEIRAGLVTVDDAAAEAALDDHYRAEVARRLKDERELILEHRDDLRYKRSRVDQRFTGRLQGLEEAAGMLTTAINNLSRPTFEETER